ncbi:hypothetical protein F511_32674 [Dorcoceras hygrometricum]|uniref:Retrotransposon gag domain-containing protein n=1 Tax=Dorcoceras hygrometricum TaxID=472368 RepID=A0A2Z7CDS6_9LAMI|nr:hypothetical protein F511_32674 [Dorcoceras hygrometricum]
MRGNSPRTRTTIASRGSQEAPRRGIMIEGLSISLESDPNRGIPFSASVLSAELPQHFKFPKVGESDGIGDPEEQLSRFENATLLHQYPGPIKCRVILTTLVRSAQQWFNLLPARKIAYFQDCFQDSSKNLLHQFACKIADDQRGFLTKLTLRITTHTTQCIRDPIFYRDPRPNSLSRTK